MSEEIIIYQEEGQAVEVRLDSSHETIWLSQGQMAELFDKDSDTIGLHLKNIYKTNELLEESTTGESSVVRQEGARQVKHNIKFYNLDAIISVGYRVNSKRAVQFRQWATGILREHLTQGWTLSRQRFELNARELEAAMALVKKAAQSPELQGDTGRGLVVRVAPVFCFWRTVIFWLIRPTILSRHSRKM